MTKFYSPEEERFNIYSHLLGCILSVVGLVFLILKSSVVPNQNFLVANIIFGFSLIILYGISTLYHSTKEIKRRARFRILDHAAIYLLIAGTYTPFCIGPLAGETGELILWIVWITALVGIVLKVFFTGKFDLLSTIAYVLMGWLVVLVWEELNDNLSFDALFWLMAGGISYTSGAVVYAINKIKYNHATFHVFVLLGSLCHFISVYFYLLK